MPRFKGIPISDEEVASVNKATPKGPRFQLSVTPPPTEPTQYIPSTMPDPTIAQLEAAGRAQAAQETGPLDSMLIGMGRTGDRLVEGARDLYDMPAAFMGDMQARERRDLREAEQARATQLYSPLSQEHPVATTLGEALPYMAAPSAGAAARGVGMDAARAAFMGNVVTPGLLGLTEYGTPQERLQRGALAAGAGYAANAAARVAGGRGINTGDEYLDDVVKRGQQIGFQPLPSQMTRDRSLQIKEAAMESNPRTAKYMENIAERNKRQLTKIAADSVGLNDVDRLTPYHLQKARDEIKSLFDKSAQNVTVSLGDDFAKQADQVFYDYIATPGRSADKAMSNRIAETVQEITKKGKLSADEYLKYTSDLAKDARGLRASGNNAAAEALEDVRSALDDAFDKSAGDLPTLKTARDRWRSLLMIEQSVNDAGDVSFAKLGSQLRKNDKWGYLRGNRERELYDAVRFYNVFPQAFGRSGTAERLGSPSILSSIFDGMAKGAGAGWMVGQPQAGMAVGGLVGAARPITDPMAAALYTSPRLNRGLLDMAPETQALLGRSLARAGLLAVSPKLNAYNGE